MQYTYSALSKFRIRLAPHKQVTRKIVQQRINIITGAVLRELATVFHNVDYQVISFLSESNKAIHHINETF